ncbi:hypothetical protein NPX90_26170 [Bacillus paranthracis]|uniref:hypothetical protein n=1 Tax=Bacillus paranthracis TaxID=2026186 RepID=UPI0021114E6A|nr:hypothetical protein [Bacillus paranthracis]MCQ6524975.1 hypothetical protein [Bacillus paranthracis]
MAEKSEMIFDGLRDVFAQHSVIGIDEFDIAPEQELAVLFGNDVNVFGNAIAHFLAAWEDQVGQRGYINVQLEDLFHSFKYFNDVYVYFCLILEV